MIVAAYGLILPQTVLDIPPRGCINIHASLLPRWRGAAPIERAIEAGDKKTGITIMQMEAGLDTGSMLLKKTCLIEGTETGGSLHDKLALLGGEAITEYLEKMATGEITREFQDNNESTYATKLIKPEAIIDWAMDAEKLAKKIRAFNPANVCYSLLNGERIKINADKKTLGIVCGSGILNIEVMQLPNKKAIPTAAILNARSEMFAPGEKFSQP